jgi:hypothetical protein
MPFINGRYHVNPTMGAALEAAREAEAALLASQDQAHRNSDDASDSTDASAAKAPIHRVEIEASELEGLPGRPPLVLADEPGRSVPSHSGRAASGFIARIHRSHPYTSANGSSSPAPATKPETHVFSSYGDLLNFLHDELSKP